MCVSATMLSSPLREHVLVRTPGRWRVFGIFHERTVRSDQGTEQWFRNEAGEESRAPDVSWDCTCGFGESELHPMGTGKTQEVFQQGEVSSPFWFQK